MSLHIIGLGLSDAKDITVRGLETVRKCTKVFLEAYTSILLCPKEELEEFYGVPVLLADRELVEQGSDEILDAAAAGEEVAFLVVGDPFGATTHTDMVLRARERNIPVHVIHNASIMNAIACCGLQLYSFGQTISIPFFTKTWQPDSFYPRIKSNRDAGLHTLALLDIKVKEQSEINLARGRKIYEPPRFMTVRQAAEQLLLIEERRDEGVCAPKSLAIGMSRVGASTQVIVAAPLEKFAEAECDEVFGGPLHSLVLVGPKLHPIEADFIRGFACEALGGLEALNEVIVVEE
ncbi:diphthine synthase [Fonticula alba]|uniref:diphthine methyl ester synthase n=1 Tax=Fonticula alba TaxID=691883 RepID=A0A058Z5B2_FONAL|nr:diphthine synthase [Fonticula alba]KCV69440.1 diphthine synthase [Fonticula alba]|eukprot:XP_009496005.1 diphthine synthase [Fonticula alba]